MPTYEYTCPNGHDFERFFRSIGVAESSVACPQCGSIGVRRLSAGAGLLFRGSGFYITDYGKDGKKDQRTAATGDTGAATAGAAGESKAAGSGEAGASTTSSGEGKPASDSKSGGESKAGGEGRSSGEGRSGGESKSSSDGKSSSENKPAAGSKPAAPPPKSSGSSE